MMNINTLSIAARMRSQQVMTSYVDQSKSLSKAITSKGTFQMKVKFKTKIKIESPSSKVQNLHSLLRVKRSRKAQENPMELSLR